MNKLFRLIKSLDKNEKRYVLLKIDLKKNYGNLYLFLSKEKAYDELRIHNHFKGETFLNRLPVIKKYLYDFLLKCLKNYSKINSVEAQVENNIQTIKILLKKDLLQDAWLLIQKSQKICQSLELFHHELFIVKIKKKLINESPIAGLPNYKDIYQEGNSILEKMLNINQYWMLEKTISSLIKKHGRPRTKIDELRFSKVMQNTYLQNFKNAKTIKSQKLYRNIHGYYYYAIANKQKYYDSTLQLLKILENNPHTISNNILEYRAVLHNFLNASAQLGRNDHLFKTKLATLAELPKKFKHNVNITASLSELIEAEVYHLKLLMEIECQRFKHAYNMLPAYQKLVYNPNFEVSDNPFITTFHQNLGYISFGAEEYSDAITYFNYLLNLKNITVKPNLLVFIRIYILVSNFELKNYYLAESMTRSLYTYLLNKQLYYAFEKIILTFLRKLLQLGFNKQDKLKLIIRKTLDEIKILQTNKYEKIQIEENFVLVLWMQKKINQ